MKRIAFCLAGFCADSLTTWKLLSMGGFERNPMTAVFIATLGTVLALVLIAAIKSAILLGIVWFRNAVDNPQDHATLEKVMNGCFVGAIIIGWGAASNNAYFILKG